MADFLTQLIHRTQGQIPTVRPQFVPRYAPGLTVRPQTALGSVFDPDSLVQTPQAIPAPERLRLDESTEGSWRSPLLLQDQPLTPVDTFLHPGQALREDFEVAEQFSQGETLAPNPQPSVSPRPSYSQPSSSPTSPASSILPIPSEPRHPDPSETGPESSEPETTFQNQPDPLSVPLHQRDWAKPRLRNPSLLPLVPLPAPPFFPPHSDPVQNRLDLESLPAIPDQANPAVQPSQLTQSDAIAPSPEPISPQHSPAFTEPSPPRDRRIEPPLLTEKHASGLRSPQRPAPESPISPTRVRPVPVHKAPDVVTYETLEPQTQSQPQLLERRPPQSPMRQPQTSVQPFVALTSGLPPLEMPTATPPVPRSDTASWPRSPAAQTSQTLTVQSERFSPSPLPTIEISIGRIEVRLKSAEATPSKSRSQVRGPKVSLSSYLQNRNRQAGGGTP